MRRTLSLMIACYGVVSCSSAPKKLSTLEFVPLEEEVNVVKAIPSDARVLQLVDTFHLTREIPKAEIRLLRRLATDRGFGVIATSGSPFDAWIAMETLLNGKAGTVRNVKDARLRGAVFLHQTAETEELYAKVDEVRKSEHPLYVTGYDPAVGGSHGWRNQFLFRVFLQYLKDYGLKKDVLALEKEIEPFLPLRKCEETGFPRSRADSERVKGSIRVLRSWIKSVAPRVSERFPALPHGRALELLPFHFEQALEMCRLKGRQAYRFEAGARYLREAMSRLPEDKKIAVWLPFREGAYGAGDLPNIGDRLKKEFGPSVFTILTVPVSGDLIASAPKPPVRMSLLGNETQLQWIFRELRVPSCVSVKSIPSGSKKYEPLLQKRPVWIDGEKRGVNPAASGDAFLVFPKVKPSSKWYFDHLIKTASSAAKPSS